jgi:nitroimidazol reductase NimA-like FMN-containing flavoprotein (pyridoxamine 5'-phosphate oxidase superfamily)
MNAFAPTPRSRIKRQHERAHYDKRAIYAVLDAHFICHVGYVMDGQPFVTPTAYWRDGDRLYWHGSSASRMLRHLERGTPACVTVTHCDGLVLARSGFHSSINYRSAMLFGTARALTGEAEKRAALEAFVERLTPGRWDELRPVTSQEIKATTVIGMEIDEAAAKVRTGPPKDDEPDYDLDVWAGVLPFGVAVGEPEPDPRLKPRVAVPAYLKDWRLG